MAIKQICDLCGKSRHASSQNAIDSVVYQHPRHRVHTHVGSRGQKERYWRFRICPMGCTLCKACIYRLYNNSRHLTTLGWVDEFQLEQEDFDLVQDPEAAKVPRFDNEEQYLLACDGDPIPQMRMSNRVQVLEPEGAEKPVLWVVGPDGYIWPKR